ncbi:MAG: ATP-binding protein [Lachnospiraceae bacterium]|nr:ATP-binding protein [Lachnospiraceae bacterium]
MNLKRKIYDRLLEWKKESNGKSAVLIEGARRVGKSTIAKEFAENEYSDYILLDFALETKEVRQNFEDNMGDLDTFFRNLFVIKGKELPRRQAVIIFDEIQLFPTARQAIKYLVADGRYDYIETGSLISIKKNVKDILIPSEEEKIKMYPMDFEEFLWAKGNTVTMPAIKEAFEKRKPLGDLIHRKTLQLFREYIAVGGMPQAVLEYVNGNSFSSIDRVKQGILSLYEDDLKKYDDNEKEKASLIFKTIPKQLSDHNMHFTFSEINANARYVNYVESVEFVAESMIGNLCANVTMPDVLMELYADRSNFKLYMGDTGLLVSQMIREGDETEDIYRALIYDKLGSNLGMIFENVVAQMLKTSGNALYFHEYKYTPKDAENEKKYEIDFLLVKNKKVCPIEVKSSGYATHKSFDYFKEKYPIKLQERYIIYTKDLKFEDGITYIPAYMAGLL